jgi:hypothetical protein
VVTLKPGPVVDLYRAEGIETRIEQGISDFSHTTLEWYGGRDWWRLPGKLLRIPASIRRTRKLVEEIAVRRQACRSSGTSVSRWRAATWASGAA